MEQFWNIMKRKRTEENKALNIREMTEAQILQLYNDSNETDCFFHRIPLEILQIITEMFEEETLKVETVGYRYKKQLLEWSDGFTCDQKIVLLYNATRDGFCSQVFHDKCDNKGATWTVIEDVNGNIFGGYTSASWQSRDDYVYDPSAYLFTLVNPHGIPPTTYKLREDESGKYSIRDRHQNLPTFGGGYDLYVVADKPDVYSESHTRFPYSYQDTTGLGNVTFTGHKDFQSKEVEVWGILPN